MSVGVQQVLLRSRANKRGKGFPLAPIAGWSMGKSQSCGL